jgi:hypothetical protein
MPHREQLERWLSSEESGEPEIADAAFAHLFGAVPKIEPRADFVPSTVAAISRMRARRRRMRSLAWAAMVVLALGGAVVASLAAAPATTWAVKTGVTILSHGMPWLIAYATEAVNLWWVIARLGTHLTAALATLPRAAALVGVELVGIFAFFALQRLVRFERRGEMTV